MKKLYLFLLLFGISLLPSFVYALSDSNYFEIVDYGILGGSNVDGQTLYKIYDTSNNFIQNLINTNSSLPYYEGHILNYESTSSYIHYRYIMFFNDTELYIDSCNTSNSFVGFELTFKYLNNVLYGVKYNRYYYYDFYYKKSDHKYYNNSNLTVEFTGLSELQEHLNISSPNSGGFVGYYSTDPNMINLISSSGGYSTNTSSLRLYINNNKLSYCHRSYVSSPPNYNISRGIRYVDSGGELIAEYDVGDVVDGYYDLYFSKPQYLNNYKKVTLESGIEYVGISGVSSGYVYIPTGIYEEYYPFLFYYDTDLDIQPYENNIYESEKMPDGFYYRIPFNLVNSPNSELIMISKDLYGYDDSLSYDIYVPNDSYIGEVTVVSYNGGNTFDFDYKDSNDDIVNKNFFTYDESLMKGNDLFSGLFEKFGKNFYGLSDIVAMPLNLVLSLTSSTCSNLVLPLPFVNSSITLPCMSSIYSSYFGGFYILYQVLVSGFISYWILLDMFRIIKNLKDPSNDKVEVLRL